MSRTLRLTLALGAVALFATAAAFAATSRTHASDTFVFGTEGDPVLVDGALVSTALTSAVNQMFEGLVGLKAGTTKVIPSLAKGWSTSKNGLSWTFKFRQGVKFHDGTPFDARSVCFNFNRGTTCRATCRARPRTTTGYSVFGGYAKPATGNPGPDKSLYHGCKVVNAVDRPARPQPSLVLVPGSSRAPGVRDREPGGTRQVQGGCGHRGRRWLLPADRNVRHLEPGGHRPVQVRIVEDRRQARDSPGTTATGAPRPSSRR